MADRASDKLHFLRATEHIHNFNSSLMVTLSDESDLTFTVRDGPLVLDQGTLIVSPSRPSTLLQTICRGF